ncbi:hypothetical protein Vadar_029331 [Vaccinium darrowii]|uniref:Uncharacterized protein n=1 Tax=Vaccinium darrowii TaxID=229202 RepID=A0ACB7XTY7_9ERIC|nr:hypothetical protein Vadar_029331 [Vaccinium darrowii]
MEIEVVLQPDALLVLVNDWTIPMAVFKLSLLLLLLSLMCFLSPPTQATDVHYCDKKASYDVKVSEIEITPYPVARGKPATFSISASTGEAISGGKLVIDVSYFWFHVYSESHDLCEKTSCPVSVGNFVISHSQELPGFTPPGSYTLTMKLEDENNSELTCITFDFSIGFLASEAVADI